jgi:16S rRNA (guanine527-N7)-methyltransferase
LLSAPPSPHDITPEAFVDLVNVSRETLQKLQRYLELLREAQGQMNLVAPSTMDQLWRRHVLDSAQLWRLLPAGTHSLLDFGSGAGFPGLVLSIMGVPSVRLAEGNPHKAAFLREVAQQLALNVEVFSGRFSQLRCPPADVITARALAPVHELLALAASFRYAHTQCLWLKGREFQKEILRANQEWAFPVRVHSSLAHQGGVVLAIGSFKKIKKKRGGHPSIS